MNEFFEVGLYNHNADSYRKIRIAYLIQNIVGIVHATGTGKTYNGLQLAYDNKSKKIVWVVPSNGIIEHIKKTINDNPYLDMERDFPNLEFITYQSLCGLSREEISEMEIDMLILDEFHHIGAPIWGARVNDIIETHPGIQIFGMTAYTVRDRGTPYERDMALDGGKELFSDKIVSRYDLCDAILDGVLPKPIYRSCHVNLLGMEQKLESLVKRYAATSKEYQEYMSILNNVKKRIAEAPSMIDVIRKNVKPDGKYIYFCPSNSIDGTNDIETIKEEAIGWFKQYIPEENIMFYTSLSSMTDHGKSNREAFYNDLDLEGNDCSNKLRVMFTINQYNEGIHAPNVDGVIMGRSTCSDIIWGEQIGRGLSVRGDTKQKFDYYMNYSVDELIKLCKERNIDVSYGTSKVEMIEKLIAPTIIDLVDNYEFIYELENNLRDRIKERQENGFGFNGVLSISDASFDIDVVNHDLFEMLCQVKNRLENHWDVMYEYAKKYYEENGNLVVPANYVNEDGIKLGQWISEQRRRTDPDSDRGTKLLEIGMIFESIDEYNWNKMFECAKKYYEEHGDLEVPARYITDDGFKLGQWIGLQRKNIDPNSGKGQRLLEIGMRFEKKYIKRNWEEIYEYAKKFFYKYHNLEIPQKFKTNDGISYDENGIKLGQWISEQRRRVDPSSEKGQKLLKIGMRFKKKVIEYTWEEMYDYAKKYYNYHGNLEVPSRFKTDNGYEFKENGSVYLGQWIARQRKNEIPESEHGRLLLEIGMRFNYIRKKITWEEMYKYALKYYIEYGNLDVPYNYVNEKKIKLGQWIGLQRKHIDPESEKGKLLSSIGMIWNVKKNKEDVNNLCKEYGIDVNKNKLVIKSISYKELKVKLLFLNDSGIPITDDEGILHEIFSMSSMNMKLKYDVSLEDLINKYIVSFGKGSNI